MPVEVAEEDVFPDAIGRVQENTRGGVAYEDARLAKRCMDLVEALPIPDAETSFGLSGGAILRFIPQIIARDAESAAKLFRGWPYAVTRGGA